MLRKAASLTTKRCQLQVVRCNSMMTKTTVEANSVQFSVTISNPDASKVVLCLPGQLGTAETDFKPHLLKDGLAEEFCMVAIDPRGYGGSRPPERDYPLDFYQRDADDALAIMHALGHDSFSVLGWSDGGNAALLLAAKAQRAVERLVVWGANSSVSKEDVDAYEQVRNVKESWSKRMLDERVGVFGSMEHLQILNDRATDGQRDILERGMGDVCLAALHKIIAPTLVLHGAHDAICSEFHPRYISRMIPHATLQIFPEASHNLHLRYADEFKQVVKDFLLASNAEPELHSEPDIDAIAYGFMGSKALFAALSAGVFDAIDTGAPNPVALSQIERACSVQGDRLQTLITACVGLGLVRKHRQPNVETLSSEEMYTLPQASQQQLCRAGKRYWGDYITRQVDQQFYRRMADLDDTLRTGDVSEHNYEAWFDHDPDAARQYTEAQHNGSLATAFALLKRVDLSSCRRLLDVGGGSGAFCIAAARKLPLLERATVLDLPNVSAVAAGIVADEPDPDVRKKINTLGLSATKPSEWFEAGVKKSWYDVVLMSYVSGSIPADALKGAYENAYASLEPGGTLILHDFMVNNDGSGPVNAALWGLAHVTVNPAGVGLRPGRLVTLLEEVGFKSPRVLGLIPGMTQLILVRKPY